MVPQLEVPKLAKGAPGNSHDEFGNSNAGRFGEFQSSHADNDSSESASAEYSAVGLGLLLH
jgi:hypothetical protein